MKEAKHELVHMHEPDHGVEIIFKESVHTPGTERFTLWVKVDGICKLIVSGVDKDKLVLSGLDLVLSKENSG